MSRLSCRRLLRGEALNERESETIGLAGLRCFNIATASGGAPPLLGRLSFDCIFFAHHHLSLPSLPSIVNRGHACGLRAICHLPRSARAAAQLNKHWHTSVTTVDDAGNRRCSSAKNGFFGSSPANENRSMDSRIVRASHMPQMRRFLTSCLPKRHTCAF